MTFKVSNDETTTVEEIKTQLQELRPLPLGMNEFNDFFERIWSGALITGEPGRENILRISVRSLLADEVISLPGGKTHETDLYFINRARKLCANQVCLMVKDQARKDLMVALEAEKAALNKEA